MNTNSNNAYYDEVNKTLARMVNFLKTDEFEQANACCDYLLHMVPGYGSAYLGKLLAEYHLHEPNELLTTEVPFTVSENYKHALYYSDAETKQFLRTAPYENFYIRAKNKMMKAADDSDLKVAAGMFRQISGYRDSDILFKQCSERAETNRLTELYEKAAELQNSASGAVSWQAAADAYACLNGFRDSIDRRNFCIQKANDLRRDELYNSAPDPMACETTDELQKALSVYESLQGWKDADQKAQLCRDRLNSIKKASKKKRNRTVLGVLAVILLVVIGSAVILWGIPFYKYTRAEDLMKTGAYSEASALFQSISGFRDSDARALEARNAFTERNYQNAAALLSSGAYLDAAKAFTALGDYKDSPQKVAEAEQAYTNARVEEALSLLKSGSLTEGIELLNSIEGFDGGEEIIDDALTEKASALSKVETAEAAAELETYPAELSSVLVERLTPEAAARLQMFAAVVGDVIKFGQYEQSAAGQAEAIEWIVLDHQKGIITMISRYALEALPYNDEPVETSWSDCTLRNWLNNDFYNEAFSDEEKGLIQTVANENSALFGDHADGLAAEDHVYLLSVSEAELYLTAEPDRQCEMTALAAEKTGSEETYASWWLRTPGYDYRNAAYVYTDGSIHRNGIYVSSMDDLVRPVVQIIP